jgi:hypothetical protein
MLEIPRPPNLENFVYVWSIAAGNIGERYKYNRRSKYLAGMIKSSFSR